MKLRHGAGYPWRVLISSWPSFYEQQRLVLENHQNYFRYRTRKRCQYLPVRGREPASIFTGTGPGTGTSKNGSQRCRKNKLISENAPQHVLLFFAKHEFYIIFSSNFDVKFKEVRNDSTFAGDKTGIALNSHPFSHQKDQWNAPQILRTCMICVLEQRKVE